MPTADDSKSGASGSDHYARFRAAARRSGWAGTAWGGLLLFFWIRPDWSLTVPALEAALLIAGIVTIARPTRGSLGVLSIPAIMLGVLLMLRGLHAALSFGWHPGPILGVLLLIWAKRLASRAQPENQDQDGTHSAPSGSDLVSQAQS